MSSIHVSPRISPQELRRVRSAGDAESAASRPSGPDRGHERRGSHQDNSPPRLILASDLSVPGPSREERPSRSRSRTPPVFTRVTAPRSRSRSRSLSPARDWEFPLDMPPSPTAESTPIRHTTRTSYLRRFLQFLGYAGASRERRELVSLIWNMSFGFVQLVATVALLAYSATHRSPIQPSLTEWKACDRPLGAWNSIWILRVLLGCFMSGWGWCRDRRVHNILRERTRDAETGDAGNEVITLPSSTNPGVPMSPGRRNATSTVAHESGSSRPPILPQAKLYARLSLLLSLLSMTWFLTAHILVYTSLSSCRRAAPHLWWLTFGILCILYVMVLEILLIALIVFVIGPLAFLFWNLVLVCIGRHPLQNPHYINPEIGKLPKSVVESIPLVLYIPPPIEGSEKEKSDTNGPTAPAPVYNPASHTYPPKPPVPQRRRFRWLRPRRADSDKNENGAGKESGGSSVKRGKTGTSGAWEDNWERGDYPFVRLEGNRAACAVCLMDFEEPPRAPGNSLPVEPKPGTEGDSGDTKGEDGKSGEDGKDGEDGEKPRETEREERAAIEEVPLNDLNAEFQRRLQLEDAGMGAQPLRLLPCGHVFHKTCLDPWLTNVSGRCPTCQRAVVLPPESGKSKRRGRGTR
ncbi:hypothetical protein BD410DRAFT_786214 [Rickenella mellea]|uniref:RING-type domain-containing protein n=1 Tax=Rickenella mellea TaxID=50990 RepID=A0A4Y7Q8Z3_9AGAM|nr:hypothetical protein BD410DRAFT_786214 [Rickenella mellea]